MRHSSGTVEASALLEELERRFITATERVSLGGGDVEVTRPRSAEDLINEADFERDERLPYWAELWPSSVVLAGEVEQEDGAHRALLELGCGVGLVTIAAVRAGFDVTATDYYEDALLFTRANAWRALGQEVRTRHVDWRALPGDLGRYSRVLGSDVLYERPYGALVAGVLEATLAVDGVATLADPGRVGAEVFVEECAARGLSVRVEPRPYRSGSVRQTIRLYQVVRRAS